MSKIILAGVRHGPKDAKGRRNLMGPESQLHFREHITPLISEKTQLVIEGINLPRAITRGERYYAGLREGFGNALDDLYPPIGGYDCRIGNNNLENYRNQTKILSFMNACMRTFEFVGLPKLKTFSEVLTYMRSNNEFHLQQKSDYPLAEFKSLAEWARQKNKKFDRSYIAAMKSFDRQDIQCVVVVGAIHAVSIGLQTEYEPQFLYQENEETVQEAFTGYLFMYAFPEGFLQHTAA